MTRSRQTPEKRGYTRLVVERADDGSVITFVDTRVGGHTTIETDGGPEIATTGKRTFGPAARKSHRYSALGRAR